MKTRVATAIVFLWIMAALTASNAAAQPKEVFLFTNGTIYTDVDQKVGSLLVEDGVVVAHNVAVAQVPQATVIDLKNGVAYPGFNDSHVHLLETGYILSAGVDLLTCRSVDDIVEALAEKVKETPADGIVIGAGFSLRDYDKWTLADLAKIDAATGGRPAFLGDKLGHNAIVNSAAMKLAGLSPETPVPLGGKMGRENGRLTGMMRESAMSLAWDRMTTRFDREKMKAGALWIMNNWASLGYTSIVDLMGGPGTRFPFPEIFLELEQSGELPLRVNYCYLIRKLSDVDVAVSNRNIETDWVRFVGGKIFVDGAYAGGQAWTSWQNQQGGHGLQEIYTDDVDGPELNLNRIVERAESYGMSMHYHTQGDRAIGAVLDALDKARDRQGVIRGTHTLIHLAFPTQAQLERIKSFGGQVVTTVQPGFWPVEADAAYYYGDRASAAYPVKKLIENKILVGFSTDFSVSPPEYAPAMVVMGVALTGGGDPKKHAPLSARDAVRAFTEGSARTTGKTDTGKLAVGFKADLVVYDRDLYTVPPEKFSKDVPQLLATYVNGRRIYPAR